MGDRLFIQTGATSLRGVLADVRVSWRLGKRGKGTTLLVTGSPYRRVYEDAGGLWVNWFGSKCRVFLAYDNQERKK